MLKICGGERKFEIVVQKENGEWKILLLIARNINFFFFFNILTICRASSTHVYYSLYVAFSAPALPSGPREGMSYQVVLW